MFATYLPIHLTNCIPKDYYSFIAPLATIIYIKSHLTIYIFNMRILEYEKLTISMKQTNNYPKPPSTFEIKRPPNFYMTVFTYRHLPQL